MLKKKNRLSKFSEIKGLNFSSPQFNVKVSKGGEGETRLAFIVSKKIEKSAVLRNRTKRVLKKSVSEILKNILAGNQILIIAKKSLEFSEKEEVKKNLTEIFKKAQIYK